MNRQHAENFQHYHREFMNVLVAQTFWVALLPQYFPPKQNSRLNKFLDETLQSTYIKPLHRPPSLPYQFLLSSIVHQQDYCYHNECQHHCSSCRSSTSNSTSSNRSPRHSGSNTHHANDSYNYRVRVTT